MNHYPKRTEQTAHPVVICLFISRTPFAEIDVLFSVRNRQVNQWVIRRNFRKWDRLVTSGLCCTCVIEIFKRRRGWWAHKGGGANNSLKQTITKEIIKGGWQTRGLIYHWKSGVWWFKNCGKVSCCHCDGKPLWSPAVELIRFNQSVWLTKWEVYSNKSCCWNSLLKWMCLVVPNLFLNL